MSTREVPDPLSEVPDRKRDEIKIYQFFRSDLEHHTDGNCRGAGGAEHVWSGHALFTEKVARSEQRNRGFFATLGNNRELSLTQPKIEQTVGTVSLR